MKAELLVFEGCPNVEAARGLLKDCMAALGIALDITEVQVDTPELARLLAFPGSPTLRVNDADVDPTGEPVEGSLACRTYRVDDRLQGLPDRAKVLAALRKAQEAESHACCTPITHQRDAVCPSSGTKGRPVKALTLRALLKPHLKERVRDEVYRFCGDPSCEVVYFSSDGKESFVKADLAVRVGIKEAEAPRPLCYCFGHSFESIQAEYASAGACTAVEAIRAEVKAGACHCEITNPGGACCLGDVIKAVKGMEAGRPTASPVAASQADGLQRRTAWTAVGLGLLASACCWIPLALAGVGVAGGAAGAKVAWMRPWALGGLGLLLAGLVGWWAYRRVALTKLGDDCCAVAPRFPTLPVVVLALSFAGAWSVPKLVHPGSVPPGEIGTTMPVGGTLLVLSTPQFDCPPCAGTLPQTMAQTPGVASVQMDFDKRETRIAFKPGADVDGTLARWDQTLGFSGKVIQRQP